MDGSSICEFYRNRSVLVTGGTGFMGKTLIEKLLRTCDVDNIFLLVRKKAGGNIEDRLEEIVNTPIFEHLKNHSSERLKKLVPINGDVSLPEMGLSVIDRDILKSRVSIVFHVAARIKFDRNIKEAVDINVKGTRRVLELCHQLPILEALVYASTAYVHPDKKILREEIYDSPIEPQELIDSVDSMSPDQLEQLMNKLLGKCPNVYSFTKSVAEQVLRDEGGSIPLVIVRPSIVTPAWKEPLPGWTDNINGPAGIIAGVQAGIMRVYKADPATVGDVIPVDYPTNVVIAAAWHKATYKPPHRISVYNCGTGYSNPITWGKFIHEALKFIRKYPSQRSIWYPGLTASANAFKYEACVWIYHYLPAYILDEVARLTRGRPRLKRLYDKAYRATQCQSFYACNEWLFHTDNMIKLHESMSEVDRRQFDCDVRLIDWPSTIEANVKGVRQFILKENPNTLPAAQRKLIKYFWIRLIFRLVIWLLFSAFLFYSLSLFGSSGRNFSSLFIF